MPRKFTLFPLRPRGIAVSGNHLHERTQYELLSRIALTPRFLFSPIGRTNAPGGFGANLHIDATIEMGALEHAKSVEQTSAIGDTLSPLSRKDLEMTKSNVEPRRFVQVSLSPEFATKLREQAEMSDRSLAAQLEHYAKLAGAIEAFLPASAVHALKTGGRPSEVLARLGEFLSDPALDSLRATLSQRSGAVYGSDPANPDRVLRRNGDGSTTTGVFDARGNFVPTTSPPDEKEKGHGKSASTPIKPQPKRRVADRPRTSKEDKRTPQAA